MCRFAAPTCWNFYHMIRMTSRDPGAHCPPTRLASRRRLAQLLNAIRAALLSPPASTSGASMTVFEQAT
jgi:hypothetical protein